MSNLSEKDRYILQLTLKQVHLAAANLNQLVSRMNETSIRMKELGRAAHRLNEAYNILATDQQVNET